MEDDRTDKHQAKQADQQPKEQEQPKKKRHQDVFTATGAALFGGVDKSAINKGIGETKRSFRLLRLLFCLGIGIASLFIAFGFMHKAPLGHSALKHLLALVFFAFTIRCFYVTMQLWRNLK